MIILRPIKKENEEARNLFGEIAKSGVNADEINKISEDLKKSLDNNRKLFRKQ